MPFIKLPTNTHELGNNSIEGGIIFPLAAKLSADWDIGAEAAPVLARNEDNHGYHLEFINTITFGHRIIGKLGGDAEFFSNVSRPGPGVWISG